MRTDTSTIRNIPSHLSVLSSKQQNLKTNKLFFSMQDFSRQIVLYRHATKLISHVLDSPHRMLSRKEKYRIDGDSDLSQRNREKYNEAVL